MKSSNPKICKVWDNQLHSIDEALDAVTVSMRILRGVGEGRPLASPEAIASVLLLAHDTIADTLDTIRGQTL